MIKAQEISRGQPFVGPTANGILEPFQGEHDDQALDVLPERKSNGTIYSRYLQTLGYALGTFPSYQHVIQCYSQSVLYFQTSSCTEKRSRKTSEASPKIASFLRICALRLGGSLTTSASVEPRAEPALEIWGLTGKGLKKGIIGIPTNLWGNWDH